MTLVQRAQKVRKELFERYDKLNTLWQKAEERLTKIHIPRPVEYAYSCCEPGDPGYDGGPMMLCLGLQKISGEWRICHGFYWSTNQPEADGWTPITECSAEIRVQTAKYLPELEKAAVDSAERFVPQVDEAISQLETALGQPENLAELLAERAKLNGKSQK